MDAASPGATVIASLVVLSLLEVRCVDRGEGVEKGEVAVSEQQVSKAEEAERMAFDAVKDRLSRDHEYTAKVTEKTDQWEILILPKGRVRGGGARVFLSKEPLRVASVKYLQ